MIDLVANYSILIFSCLIIVLGAFFLIRKSSINFLSGIVFGYGFFIGAPLILCLLFGEIPNTGMPVSSVRASEDGFLFLYISIVTIFLYTTIFIIDKSKAGFHPGSSQIFPNKYEIHLITIIIYLYLILTLLVFWLGGKWAGGHWLHSYGELYSSNPLGVIFGNFANVFRVILPGMLAYLKITKIINTKSHLLLLFVYITIELLLVNNRIILLFTIISLFIAYHNSKFVLSLILVMIMPAILFANHAYPIARGLMWANGFSLETISESFQIAISTRISSFNEINNYADMLAGVLEASNINVLNYVVSNFGNTIGFYYGETVLLRAATFFIPQAIWDGKPSSFGSDLGQEISNITITLNSTILGEFYGNFGFLSVLILPVLISLVSYARKILPNNKVFDICMFFCGIAALRFDFSFLVISLFCLFVVAIFLKIITNSATRKQINILP